MSLTAFDGTFWFQRQVWLSPPKQFDIDRGQKIGVHKCAMQIAMGVIDLKPAAECVQICLCPREFTPRHGQRVGRAELMGSVGLPSRASSALMNPISNGAL